MPLPAILGSIASGTARAAGTGISTIGRSIGTGIGQLASGTASTVKSTGNLFKENAGKIVNGIKGGKPTVGENTQIKETSNIIKQSGDETEKAVKQSGDETEKAVKQSGDETEKAIKQSGDETKSTIEKIENNSILKEKEKTAQTEQRNRKNDNDVRLASSERLKIASSIDNLGNIFKQGLKKEKPKDTSILGSLLSFAPGLITLLPGLIAAVPSLLGFAVPLIAAIAAVGGGFYLGKKIAELMGMDGNRAVETVADVFERANDSTLEKIANLTPAGMAINITRSILEDVGEKKAEEAKAKGQQIAASALETPEASEKFKQATENVQSAGTLLFQDLQPEELNESGEFKDVGKKESALNEANMILIQFKGLLDAYKNVAMLPEGRKLFAEKIKPFIKEASPKYNKIAKLAGIDAPNREPLPTPEGIYGIALTELGTADILKKDVQFSTKLQTFSTSSPDKWKSSGGLSLRGGEEATAELNKTSTGSQITAKQSSAVLPKPQDSEIKSNNTSTEGNINVNVMAPGGQSPSGPKSTPAPSPEGNPSRAPTDSLSDSEMVAFAVGKQTQHSTFPAIA